jgi:hypothetical protein
VPVKRCEKRRPQLSQQNSVAMQEFHLPLPSWFNRSLRYRWYICCNLKRIYFSGTSVADSIFLQKAFHYIPYSAGLVFSISVWYAPTLCMKIKSNFTNFLNRRLWEELNGVCFSLSSSVYMVKMAGTVNYWLYSLVIHFCSHFRLRYICPILH